MSVDGIVWGTLLEVRPITSPALEMVNAGRLVETCEGRVEPALDLVIDVAEALRGEAAGVLTVRVGAGQLSEWTPWPGLGDRGDLWWHFPAEDAGPLIPGDQIGVAYRDVEELGIASLMGEMLLGFAPSDGGPTVRFQPFRRETCHMPPPLALEGQTFPSVRLAVAGCRPSSTADTRRQIMWNVWGPGGASATAYHAAKCLL
jgi:hypothetical protein